MISMLLGLVAVAVSGIVLLAGCCAMAALWRIPASSAGDALDELWDLLDKRKQRKEEEAEEKIRLDEYNRKEEKRKRIMMASFLDDPDFHTPNYNKRPIPLSASVPNRDRD